jgi:anti-sigma factor RsiW
MLSCEKAERLIARYVDGVLDPVERASLDAHLASCGSCRSAVAEQTSVAAVLRGREPMPSRNLVPAVSARIGTQDGVFAVANWRAWTLGLAPVAAALALAAYLGIGASTSGQPQQGAAAEEWTLASSTPVLLQSGSSGDALVEAVLTGTETSSEPRDAR